MYKALLSLYIGDTNRSDMDKDISYIEICVANKHAKNSWRSEVYYLLSQADKEFFPPLSMRTSTSQQELKTNKMLEDGVEKYFQEMWEQEILLATTCGKNKRLAGFMSYKNGYQVNLPDDSVKCWYVSTVVVAPEFRGQGITARFYAELQKHAKIAKYPIVTRTWSTNHAHLTILEHAGFKLVLRLPDDRGKGIDTLYYKWGENV